MEDIELGDLLAHVHVNLLDSTFYDHLALLCCRYMTRIHYATIACGAEDHVVATTMLPKLVEWRKRQMTAFDTRKRQIIQERANVTRMRMHSRMNSEPSVFAEELDLPEPVPGVIEKVVRKAHNMFMVQSGLRDAEEKHDRDMLVKTMIAMRVEGYYRQQMLHMPADCENIPWLESVGKRYTETQLRKWSQKKELAAISELETAILAIATPDETFLCGICHEARTLWQGVFCADENKGCMFEICGICIKTLKIAQPSAKCPQCRMLPFTCIKFRDLRMLVNEDWENFKTLTLEDRKKGAERRTELLMAGQEEKLEDEPATSFLADVAMATATLPASEGVNISELGTAILRNRTAEELRQQHAVLSRRLRAEYDRLQQELPALARELTEPFPAALPHQQLSQNVQESMTAAIEGRRTLNIRRRVNPGEPSEWMYYRGNWFHMVTTDSGDPFNVTVRNVRIRREPAIRPDLESLVGDAPVTNETTTTVVVGGRVDEETVSDTESLHSSDSLDY